MTLLEEASTLAPDDARILNDLAAAYHVRAQLIGRAEDLVRALASARRALQKNGSLPEARFNVALALEALGLPWGAMESWQEYVRQDPLSGWGGEARDRLQVLQADDAVSSGDEKEKKLIEAARQRDREGIRLIMMRHPQTVRLLVEERLFPDWAKAVAEGRQTDSEILLRSAGTIAAELKWYGGDRLPFETVAALRAAVGSGGERLAALVEGHLAYEEGLDLYKRFEIGAAAGRFKVAREAFLVGGSPFRGWAEFYLAACDYQLYDYTAAQNALASLRERAVRSSHPNLGGRALWVTGLCLIDAAQPVEALDAYEESLAIFRRSRETESLTSVHALLADALRYLGEDRKAWRHRHQALRGLAGLRDVRRRHAIVGEAAMAALKLGEPLAAISFQNESVQFGEIARNAIDISEALRYRAAIYLRAGDHRAALADLKEAGRRAVELQDERVRQIASGRILEIEARLSQKTDPKRAIDLLTQAEQRFRNVGYRFPLAGLDVARAQAWLTAGQPEEAEANLRAAVQEIEVASDQALQALRKGEGRALWGELSLREAYFEEGEDPFDQLLLHSASAGEARAAWELAEREQARDFLFSLLSLPSRSRPIRITASMVHALPAREIEGRVPSGTALLQYALLEDHLLVWLVRNDRLRLWIERAGRAGLEPWIARARVSLSGGRGAAEAREGLERLFRILVEPALGDLTGVETLVFIPDESLQDVPFAALISPTTGRYLVEDHAVMVAPTATLYVDSLQRDRELAARRDLSALALGNPSYDRSLFQSLPELRYARAEAAGVAKVYPRSEFLEGTFATKARFLARAGRHGIVHATAHAVIREDSPLLSTLALAPDDQDSGVLYAHEFLYLHFERTRLVVLSACSTAGGRSAGGRAGFVRPLLGAGVPAVVASLWPVDDRATARLFAVFHQLFRAGSDAPAALRAAQLALLRGDDPALRAPAAWAGFEVFGGAASSTPLKGR